MCPDFFAGDSSLATRRRAGTQNGRMAIGIHRRRGRGRVSIGGGDRTNWATAGTAALPSAASRHSRRAAEGRAAVPAVAQLPADPSGAHPLPQSKPAHVRAAGWDCPDCPGCPAMPYHLRASAAARRQRGLPAKKSGHTCKARSFTRAAWSGFKSRGALSGRSLSAANSTDRRVSGQPGWRSARPLHGVAGERPRAGWPCQRLPGCPAIRHRLRASALAHRKRGLPGEKKIGHTGKARSLTRAVRSGFKNRGAPPPANRFPPPTRPPGGCQVNRRGDWRGRASRLRRSDDLRRGKPRRSREMLRRHSRSDLRTKRGCRASCSKRREIA